MSTQKDEHERDVFLNFAMKAGLKLDSNSVQTEVPPLPDISCRIDGLPHYFELSRMVHEARVTRILARAGNTSPTSY